MRITVAAAVFAGVLATVSHHVDAHDPFPSKYTFHDDVAPLFREHCGSCHVEGGAAPMPVGAYAAVKPWAQAIVEQLQLGRMPPSFVDHGGPRVIGARRLPARDLDMMLTWAAGGAPEGDRAKAAAAMPVPATWPLGPPDAMLPMELEHIVPAAKQDEVREFTLRTSWPAARWIRAVDLQPGTRSMVRDAQVSTADGAVMALWIAGEPALAAPRGTAFRLPAGAALTLRVHYRKSWDDSQVARADRSTVGLYFAGAGTPIRSVAAPMVDRPVRVLAVRPTVPEPMPLVEVTAVAPDGRRRLLLRLRDADPGWPRRYWLATPVTLAAGTRIEAPLPVALDVVAPLPVALDVVAP